MDEPLDLSPPPQLAALPAALDAVAAWGLRCGLSDNDIARVQIVVDEWMVNAIGHGGLAPERDWLRVQLSVLEARNGVHLTLSDSAGHFAPDDLPSPDTDATLDARRPGGLGVEMMRRLSQDWRHEALDLPGRPGRGNRLHLTVPVGESPDKP